VVNGVSEVQEVIRAMGGVEADDEPGLWLIRARELSGNCANAPSGSTCEHVGMVVAAVKDHGRWADWACYTAAALLTSDDPPEVRDAMKAVVRRGRRVPTHLAEAIFPRLSGRDVSGRFIYRT
jgi:hypothetical protein